MQAWELMSSASARKPADLDGRGVMYHYLEKELQQRDVFMFQMLAARLISDLGIWIHPTAYQQLPIVLPHVIRDQTSRARSGGMEKWGAPTSSGLLRDDNSLVKEAIKSLPIDSPVDRSFYRNRRIGRASGWVAAHVWQLRTDGSRASHHPDTNSFVPNLVWLPQDVARLTDRPGSFVQQFTQALSASIYGSVPLHPMLQKEVDRAWDSLSIPDASAIPRQALPPVSQLNFFVPPPTWVEGRIEKAEQVHRALVCAAQADPVPAGRPRRYFQGVGALDSSATLTQRTRLATYLTAVRTSQTSPQP